MLSVRLFVNMSLAFLLLLLEKLVIDLKTRISNQLLVYDKMINYI